MLGDSREPIPSIMSTADILEVILGISEGPIKGLKNGVKNFYFGDTPVVASDNSPNFDSFDIRTYLGNEIGENIQSLTGGFGSTVGVGVPLEQDVPVVRSGVTQNIDFLDVRINLSALYRTTDRGNRLRHQGYIKLEYRATGASAWTPVTRLVNLAGRELTLSGSSYDIPVVTGTTVPSDSTRLFLKTNSNYAPYIGGQPADPQLVRVWRTTRAPFTKDTAKNYPQQYRVWVHSTTNEIKLFNGAQWVAPGSSKNVGANLPVTDFSTITGGVVPILGKTYSDLMLEYRIPVAKIAGTYDVRVTKLGGHDNDKRQFLVSWDSLGEITTKVFNFPGLAVTQVAARSTDQLSSMPELSGVYEGRLIRVPSNYDTVARTYSGTWNGAWKIAYSNNPAFVGYDLVMNDRYGMNAYYPVNLNKWDVYEAGQWCDVRAADGTPRFTFNGLIADRMGCREAVNYIFGILGARFFDNGNGEAVLKIDKTANPVAVFAPENVIDGVFNYSFAGISTQYNDVTVQFTNPNLNWQTDQRRVYDQAHIDKYGRIPKSIAAVGCTSEGEAIRRGKYHLVTSLSEKTSVSFKTNRQGLFVQPYDLILIADPYLNFGWSGRVGAKTSASVFSFRDPVFLEAGFPYQVTFLVPTVDQGVQTFTMPLATGQAGVSRTSLTVVGTLPAEVGPDTQFAIGAVGDTNAAPKTFRVMSVTVDGDGDNDDAITIEAVEHNRVKWDYVDGLIDTIPVDKTGDDRNVAPLPVGNFEVIAEFISGQMVLTLKWTRSPSRGVSHYLLKSSVDGDPFRELGVTEGTSFNIPNLPGGDYLFSIVPVNSRGLEGPVRYAHFEAEGDDDTTLPLIENLVATAQVGVAADGTFQANLRATWTPVNVNGVIYDVIYSRVGEDIPRRFETRTNSFVSGLVAGNATYNMLVSARVGSIELRSPTLAQIAVPGDDTIPGVPTGWKATGELRQIVLTGDRSSEPDFKEFIIYASELAGGPFVEIATITSNQFIYPTPTRTWFQVAQRDRSNNISPRTATFSAEPLTVPGLDDTAPATPTGFALSSVPGKLIATWNANTEDDLAYYDIEITQEGGNPVSFQTSSTRYEWNGVLPNVKFSARVRAVDQTGWRSPWTAMIEHTTARDTTPPAVPTGLTLKPGFTAIWLFWTANTENDLSHYEIIQSSTSFTPTAASTPTYTSQANNFLVNDLTYSTRRWFAVRAVDTSGNKSAWSSVANATTGPKDAITATDIQGVIDATSFASGIEPVTIHVGAALPTVKSTTSLMWNGKLYRWNGTAYSSDVLGQDAVVAGTVAAGAINTRELAAGAVTASIIGVGDFTNLVPDNQYLDVSGSWSPAPVNQMVVGAVQANEPNYGQPRVLTIRNIAAGPAGWTRAITSSPIPLSVGEEFFSTLAIYNNAVVRMIARITYFDSSDSYIGAANLHSGDLPVGLSKLSVSGSAPANMVKAKAEIYIDRSQGRPSVINVGKWSLTRKNGGQLIVDGSVKANHLVTDEAVITAHAQIKEATIGSVHIIDLIAGKIRGGTALLDTITVNGTALGTSTDRAADPAARVNAHTTQIEPGKIRIAGGTTLADWRKGGDETRIDGGNISANTITANKLEIGSRNITLTGVQFEHNRPAINQVYWSAGQIRWINDNGNVMTSGIPAGNATWSSGVLYLYWAKGDNNVALRSTTSLAVAMAADNICLATYEGGTKLDADYGRTIIDGSSIKTGTITATQMIKTEALITETLQIGRNKLYVPRFFTRGDLTLQTTSSSTAPISLFNNTIGDFDGGGYTATFNGSVNTRQDYDSYARFQILIDNEVILSQSVGLRTSGANTGGEFPVSLTVAFTGSASTNIHVRAWSHDHNSYAGGNKKAVVQNMSLTVAGSRR